MTRAERDDDFDFHRHLVRAIVKVCCLTSLAQREQQGDHRADMMLLSDMIAAELISHVYPGLAPEHLAEVIGAHGENVVRLYLARQHRHAH